MSPIHRTNESYSTFKASRALRDALTATMVAATSPLWLLVALEKRLTTSEEVFSTFSQALSLVPGKLGVFVRRGYYSMCLDAFAWDCNVGFLSAFGHRSVTIDRGVYIGSNCLLGSVRIAPDVTIGSNVDILSGRHQHGFTSLDEPIQSQVGTFVQLAIGRNSWIGNSSVLMADVGDNCVIGAGSVVVQPITPNSIAVGNPCAVKRQRTPTQSVERPDRGSSTCRASR